MTIERVEIAPFEPRFLGAGYRMSFVHQRVLHNRLLRITLANGRIGVGEVVRWMTYPPEEAAALEDAAVGDLVGRPLADLPGIVSELRRADFRLIGLAHGLDTAFHDLVGRAADLPVSALLGGPETGDVPEVLSLSSEAPEMMADIVRCEGPSFRVIQAKLGVDDIDTDMRRVEAVLAEMRQDQLVLADFNGKLGAEDAASALPAIRDPRLVWEEPCGRHEENIAVAARLAQPVLFDQCLETPEICAAVARSGAAWGMVVKPGLLGGLAVTRFLRDLCAASGLRMRIDGPWCGEVGAAASLHLAIGAPKDLLLGSIDLTAALETPRRMIGRPAPGRVGPRAGAGLGPLPDDLFPSVMAAA